jgi:predicted RNA binding protein YcfA (HicA-like mRNA interferase family)
MYTKVINKGKIMPKTPRLTSLELIKILEANGWVELFRKGSHKKFTKAGNDETIVVPMHNGVMKIGLQKAIMKQAGLL